MAKPRARKRRAKGKGKVRISQRTRLRKRSEQPKDTLKKVEGRPPANNAPTLRLKIRKK